MFVFFSSAPAAPKGFVNIYEAGNIGNASKLGLMYCVYIRVSSDSAT